MLALKADWLVPRSVFVVLLRLSRALATAREGQARDTKYLLFAINEVGRKFGGSAPVGESTNNADCWGNR